MSRLLRHVSLGVLVGSSVLRGEPSTSSSFQQPDEPPQAATRAYVDGPSSSYAPWVVLGVLAVGGLIAGLAASQSSSGS